MRTLITITSLLVSPVLAASQQSTSHSRSDQIAAAFTKHKDVVRVKRGVTREKYKDVRTEPVARQNVTDYSGRYEISDRGWWIEIQVGGDGRIQATGYEADRAFELKNASIAGSLLTATKVYRDGDAEWFEGVFMNRTERATPTDPGITRFGLGVLLATPIDVDGMTLDKVFYQLLSPE
jgi:hypothetical protein